MPQNHDNKNKQPARGRGRGAPNPRGRGRGGPNPRGRGRGGPNPRGRGRGAPNPRGGAHAGANVDALPDSVPPGCAVVSMLFKCPPNFRDTAHNVHDYAFALCVLRGSIVRFLSDEETARLDFVVLVPEGDGRPPPLALQLLEEHGWQIKQVPNIKLRAGALNPRMKQEWYRDTHLKAHAWGLVKYRRVLYLDADSITVKREHITHLLNCDMRGCSFMAPYDAQKGLVKVGEQEWRETHWFAWHGLKLEDHRVQLNGPGVKTPNDRARTYRQLLTGCMLIVPDAENYKTMLKYFETYGTPEGAEFEGVEVQVPAYSDGDMLTNVARMLRGGVCAMDPKYAAYRGCVKECFAIQYGGTNPWAEEAQKWPDMIPWREAALKLLDEIPDETRRALVDAGSLVARWEA